MNLLYFISNKICYFSLIISEKNKRNNFLNLYKFSLYQMKHEK